jgi:hypothetical protein
MSNTTINAQIEFEKKMTVSIITLYVFFGFLGNPLLISIMTRPLFRNKSLFRFLAVASFFNMWRIMMWVMATFSAIFGLNNSSIACKLFNYIGLLPHEASTWIELWTGIDRYISVKYPQKFLLRNSLKNQVITVLLIISINLFLNIAYLFQTDLVSGVCRTINFTIAFYNSIALTFITSLVPGLLMILFTVLIYKELRKQRTKFNQNTKKEISFLKTLVAVYILYLVCFIPYAICAIVLPLFNIPFISTFYYQVANYVCSFYSAFYFFIVFFSNKLVRSYCYTVLLGSSHSNTNKSTQRSVKSN